jgi:molecular chaperone GrpE
MVQKKLDSLLAKEGLQRLECVGQPFDPNMHEILVQVPTNEHKSGTVLEEARKGFIFKGKVLRPSVVTIACEDSKGDTTNE